MLKKTEPLWQRERERERGGKGPLPTLSAQLHTLTHILRHTNTGAALRERGKVLLVAVSAHVTSRRKHADASTTESKGREEEHRWEKEEDMEREKEKRSEEWVQKNIYYHYTGIPQAHLHDAV